MNKLKIVEDVKVGDILTLRSAVSHNTSEDEVVKITSKFIITKRFKFKKDTLKDKKNRAYIEKIGEITKEEQEENLMNTMFI